MKNQSATFRIFLSGSLKQRIDQSELLMSRRRGRKHKRMFHKWRLDVRESYLELWRFFFSTCELGCPSHEAAALRVGGGGCILFCICVFLKTYTTNQTAKHIMDDTFSVVKTVCQGTDQQVLLHHLCLSQSISRRTWGDSEPLQTDRKHASCSHTGRVGVWGQLLVG